MPLEDLIITVFCWVEEHLDSLIGDHPLRQRGFAPKLADSEVITMEVVGEFLGVDTDVGIWKYFGRHGRSWFPQLGSRTPLPSRRLISGRSSRTFISHS